MQVFDTHVQKIGPFYNANNCYSLDPNDRWAIWTRSNSKHEGSLNNACRLVYPEYPRFCLLLICPLNCRERRARGVCLTDRKFSFWYKQIRDHNFVGAGKLITRLLRTQHAVRFSTLTRSTTTFHQRSFAHLPFNCFRLSDYRTVFTGEALRKNGKIAFLFSLSP